MRMLKYVLVLILVVVLAGVVILPWVDGYYFRKVYLQNLAKLNLSPIKLQVVQYRLGWLSSNVKLHLTNTAAPDKTAGVWVNQHISHGPYVHDAILGWVNMVAEIKSEFGLDPTLLGYLKIKTATQPQLNLDTLIYFNGKLANRVNLAPLNFETDKAVKFVWEGADGSLNVLAPSNIALDATLKRLSVQTAKGESVSLQAMTSQLALQCGASGCSKSITLNTPGLTANGGGKKVDMTNVDFALTLLPSAPNIINTSVKLGFNKLAVSDVAFGPLALNFEVENFDAAALKKLEGAIFNARAKAIQQGMSPNAAMLAVLRAEGYHLVSQGVSLGEDIQLSTPYGAFTSKGKVFWPTGVPLPMGPAQFGSNVNFRVEAHVGEQLMNQVMQKMSDQMDAVAAASAAAKLAAPQAAYDTAQDVAEFKKQLEVLVSQKQLSVTGYNGILTALKQHSPLNIFSMNIQQGVMAQQVSTTAAVYLNTQYAKIEDDRNKDIAAIFVVPVTDEQGLEDRINTLATKGFISATTAKQLIQLLSQNLDDAIFTSFLNNLVNSHALSRAVCDQLIKGYKQLKGDDSSAGTPAASLTTFDKVKKFIDSNVEKGYITHDGNGYSSVVTYDHGSIKINGVPFQIPPKPPVPVQSLPPHPTAISPQPGMPANRPIQQPGASGVPMPQQPAAMLPPAPIGAPAPLPSGAPSSMPQQPGVVNAPSPQQPAMMPAPVPSNSVPVTPTPMH